jgi:hypothetical protein
VLKTVGSTTLKIIGFVWNLPNTIVGATYALVNWALGGDFSFVNGVLHVENAPLQFGRGAITLGDVVIYSGGMNEGGLPTQPGVPSSVHEGAHVTQGRAMGPLYLPANILGMAGSLVHWMARGFDSSGWMSPVHGPVNFMERGPLSMPSRPAPWR